MKTTFTLLTLCLLVGCASGPEVIAPPVEKERIVRIDQRLLAECLPLTQLIDNPKPTDVLQQHGDDVAKYKACADGKKALIEAVNTAFGK